VGCFSTAGKFVQSDFSDAIARLISLHQAGLSDVSTSWLRVVFVRLSRQQNSKDNRWKQRSKMTATKRILGDLEQGQSREQVLAAWRRQLERLWPEVKPL